MYYKFVLAKMGCGRWQEIGAVCSHRETAPTLCFQGQGRPRCEEPLLCLMAANIRRFFLRLEIFIVVT